METPTEKANLRAELRVAISKKGTLVGPGAWIPCLIQDISSNGFLIICDRNRTIGEIPEVVGEILELKCELYPEKFLQCKVEVRHITDMCLGTKIVEIGDAELSLCRQFIDEQTHENP
jgi:hypothetical protein